MQFGYLSVRTDDLATSLSFYTEVLGFTEVERFTPGPGVTLVFLQLSGVMLELYESPGAFTKGEGSIPMFGLYVDNLEAAMQAVQQAGCQWINPAPVPAWKDGMRMIGVRGPSGEHIKLVQK